MIWAGYRLAQQDDEQPRQRDNNMYNPLHMRRERNRLKKLLERRRNAIEGDREIRQMHTKQPQPQPTQHEILHDADDEEDRKSKELKVPALFRRTSSRRSDRSTSSKYRLSSLNSLCVDFGGRTSSHGVPFICGTSCCGPWVWTVIFILCTVCFIIQTYWTMKEYLQYRTIIEMQLKFEAAPFPAATVCNLNPFKYSQLIQYDDLREGFEHWERVMNARAMTEALKNDANELRKIELEERDREKRSAEKEWIFPIDKHELQKGAVYSPVFVRCTCINQEQCVPNRNPLETNASVCMCFEDVTRGLIWPCYPSTAWTVKKCTKCSISNTCPDPDRPNATKPIGNEQPCLCQGISHHCMIHPKEEIRWWNPNNYTVYPVTEPPKPTDTEEAFGLGELHDAGAITTKTRENIIFLVAALPRDTRRNLSYTLKEFVLRCSFNSQDCDMVRDFELHMDPEYGNCYTFNFNDSVKLKNSRAGPMYGLRLLLDVHQDDYLPTTEAAGVRLVVHEQHQEPFPDTFGYSAPTGFISSFGLKTKVLQRLDYPWGSCSDFFRPDPYIYKEHYSVLKGCYRNCFQMNVIKNCRCGDPRFPLPDQDIRHCEAKSVNDRSCLARMIDEQSGYHHIEKNVSEKCLCRQPCTENVFETAYSAASWPSANFKLGTACPAVASIVNDTKACTEYYRENTAYIEIYYEQLNFESLKETEGYTMVNLFSDFGGNIGLWIGFSVITIFEYGELLIEVLAYFFYVKPRRKIREIKRQAEERGKPQLPQLLHRYRSQKMADTPQDDDNTQCTRLSDSPSPEKYKHWP